MAPPETAKADARRDLTRIYAAAVSAVAPATLVAHALDGAVPGAEAVPALLAAAPRIVAAAVGKAAAAMAAALDQRLGAKLAEALVVAPMAVGSPPPPITAPATTPRLRLMRAAHPIPDASSLAAARAVLDLARRAAPDDLFILALSGGASAMLAAPAAPITLEDKILITSALLKSGASIRDLNVVRRHLSTIKGGGLLRAIGATRTLALILSDVLGNDLAAIGSGPTAADPATFSDAIGVLKRRGLWGRAPESIRGHLERGVAGDAPEILKRGDPILDRVTNVIIGDNETAVAAAAEAAIASGYEVERASELRGEADDVGVALAARLASIDRPRVCVIAGGEPVVTVRGPGRGGRAQQAALAMALELDRLAPDRDIMALFAGTDGLDGPTGAAGAFASPRTVARAREARLDPALALRRNDSNPLFAGLGDLLATGPTGTNVADLFIGLVNYSKRAPA